MPIEHTDDPSTWPGGDVPERRHSPSVAVASLARVIARLTESRDEQLRWLEAGQFPPERVMFVATQRAIEAAQVMQQVATDEASAATTDAVREIWAMRRQTEAAMRETFGSASRAAGSANFAEGSAAVALDAARRARDVEDRAVARAERVALYHLRVEREKRKRQVKSAQRVAMAALGLSVLLGGVVLGLLLG